jgi:hypothetical protein
MSLSLSEEFGMLDASSLSESLTTILFFFFLFGAVIVGSGTGARAGAGSCTV